MQLKNMVLVSDLDGTLVPNSGVISEANIAAVNRFRNAGGRFAVATGRAPYSAAKYLEALSVSSPVILDNGALIYDPVQDLELWHHPLPSDFRMILEEIYDRHPHIGIVAISADNLAYFIAGPHVMKLVAEMEGKDVSFVTIDKIPDNCVKILFRIEEEEIDRIADDIRGRRFPNVGFTKSGPLYFEMLADGVSKGEALSHLAELYHTDLTHVVSIGDYYNDIGMIRRAGLGVTLESAPDALKEAADMVVTGCDDNGVTELIDYLLENSDRT